MFFLNRNLFSNARNSNLYGGIPNREINKKVIEKADQVVGKVISDNTEIKQLPESIAINIDSLLANKNIFIEKDNSEIKYEYVTQTQTETKNVNINIDAIISNSSLAVDYRQNTVRTTSKTLSYNTAFSRAKSLAKQDLNKLAEELRNQIKKQMGNQFDASKVEDLINQAIQRTIDEFSDNQKKKSRFKPSSNTDGFVALKSGLFGLRKQGTYNLQALCNTFLTNFSNISQNKLQYTETKEVVVKVPIYNLDTNTNIENKRTELKENKEELKFLASCDLPNAILETSYENIYNDVLNNLDADNYKNAEKNIQDRVNQELLNISGTPSEIKNKTSVILGDTISYYQATLGLDFNTSPYKEVFEKALDNTIEKTIDSNTEKCDIVKLTEDFEAEINSVLCETILATESSVESNTQTVSRLSRASVTDPIKEAKPTDPPIVTEYPAKTPGGSSFKLIDYTYERIRTSGKTLTLTKPNEGMNGAILKITTPDGETSQVKIKIGPKIPKNKIEELMNVIRNLPEANIQDLAKEECMIQLFSKAELSTNAPGKVTAGTYNLATNAITIDCNNIEKIEPAVLLHELGHAVDYIPNGAYSISKEQISSTKISDAFNELKDSSKKTDYYAFKNNREFFAEYYTYKSLGDSNNNAKKIFKKRKFKSVKEEMDKIIENTRKLDSDVRVRQDNNENQTTSGNTNNGTTSGNTTTDPSNSNPKEEITSPVEIDKPESPSGSNPFEDSRNDINKYPNVDNPTNNNPWNDVNNFPDIDNSDKDDSWNNTNNTSNPGNSNVNNNGNTTNTTTGNNTSNPGNSSNETTLPDDDTSSKPSPGDGITTDINTGINVGDLVNPSTPTIPGEDSGITITDSTTKEEVIHSLIDKTIDYYTEEAIKEAQKIFGEDANIKIDVECTINEDGEIVVKVKTTVLDDKKTSTGSSNDGLINNSSDNNSNNQGVGDIPQYPSGYYPGVGINVNDYINPSTGIINTDSLISDWSASGGEVYTFNNDFEISNIYDSINKAIETGDWSSFFNEVSSSSTVGIGPTAKKFDRDLNISSSGIDTWEEFDKTGYEWWKDPENSASFLPSEGVYCINKILYTNSTGERQEGPTRGGEGMIEYKRGHYMSEDVYRMLNNQLSKQEEFDKELDKIKENIKEDKDDSIDVNHGPFDSSDHTSSVLDTDFGERPDKIVEDKTDPFKDNNSNNSTNNNWTSNQGGTVNRPSAPGSGSNNDIFNNPSSNNSNNSNNRNPFGGNSSNSSTSGGRTQGGSTGGFGGSRPNRRW